MFANSSEDEINGVALEALLDLYIEAGVDCFVAEAPQDRFSQPSSQMSSDSRKPGVVSAASQEQRPPSAPSLMPPTREPTFQHDSADETVRAARESAQSAQTLEELREALSAFEGCSLKATAKNLVFSDGCAQARLMFVGEAPGRDEDLQGRPFVGRSGKLLDRMLNAIGLKRETDAYIANIVPWRPPGNRTPTPQEAAACLPFIKRQIELCNPDILICLGGPSAQTLLGAKEGILRTRGRWFSYHTGKREIKALATLHPAYLLRQPLQKRLAWQDFQAVKKAFNETSAAAAASAGKIS